MSSNSLNVDQRIVQMQFDNAQFEQGATTTMNTLDKLKHSLDFTGQNNGISTLSKSIGNFTTAPMLASLESAKSGFSALQVAGITAISNITTRVQAMGERLIKAVTVDPVKTGWSEYESKMDSIKTILNSAKDKNGAAVSLDQVKQKIEELNTYADKTIYSFADMTNNIGKFTNAGVDLDTSVKAIQGVANAAAAAGADSNAASRAMYNFAQALSVGYVQRIDWKSIENANMATVEFKNELLKTATELKTVEQRSDGTYMALTKGSKTMKESASAAAMFTENLSTQWLTNDVMIKTLERYSDTSTDIGKKAAKAATQVFTLSKMFDTLGEAMQSGWSATWEKIVGDYEQAGELFTGINDFISGALGKRDQKRIDFLDELLNKVSAVTEIDWKKFASGFPKGAQGKTNADLHNYIEVVKKVAREHNVDIDGMIQKHKHFKDTLKEGWFTKDIFDDVNKYIDSLKTVKKEGKPKYTKQQVAALKEISKSLGDADSAYAKIGKSFTRLKTGRELIIDSFKKVFKEVLDLYKGIQYIWGTIFPKASVKRIYESLEAINKWANGFKISTKTLGRFQNTFRGIFSIIDIFRMALVAIGKGVLDVAKRILGFGGSVLDTTASIGKSIFAFRNWIKQSKIFDKAVGAVSGALITFINLLSQLGVFKIIKVGLILIANILIRIVALAFQIFNAIISSKIAVAFVNALLYALQGIAIVIGTVVSKLIEFVANFGKIQVGNKAMSAIGKVFKTIASLAYAGVIAVINGLIKLGDKLRDSETANKIFTAIAVAMATIATVIDKVVSKVTDFVKRLLQLDAVQKIIERIKIFFKELGPNLKSLGGKGLEKVTQFFANIKKHLPSSETVLSTINGLLDGSIDKLKFIKDLVGKGFKTVTDFFGDTFSNIFGKGDKGKEAEGSTGGLAKAGTTIKNTLTKFGESVSKGLEKVNTASVLAIGTWATFIFLFIQVGRLVNAISGAIKGVSLVGSNPLTKFITSLSKAARAYAKEKLSEVFLNIMKGIGILALSMAILSTCDTTKLMQVTVDLALILAMLRLVLGGFSQLFSHFDFAGNAAESLEEGLATLASALGNGIKKLGKAVGKGFLLVGIGIAVALIVYSLINLYNILSDKNLNVKALKVAIVGVIGTILLLIVAMEALSAFKVNVPTSTAASLVAMGLAIKLIADALQTFPAGKERLGRGLFALAVIMAGLTGALAVLTTVSGNNGGSVLKIAAAFVILSLAISALAIPLALLSLFNPDKVIAAGAALGIVAVSLGTFAAMSSKLDPATAAALSLLAISLGLFIKPLFQLSKLNIKELTSIGVALAFLIVTFGALAFVAEGLGAGLLALDTFFVSVGLMAAGVGAGVYLIVSAFAMLGPAIQAFVDSLVYVGEQVQKNGKTIVIGIGALVGGVCLALMANKANLFGAAFSAFGAIFGGIGAAIMTLLPGLKTLLIASIPILVLGLLGALEKVAPGAISKIVDILVLSLNTLASVIVNQGQGLARAVLNLIDAFGILVMEIFVETKNWLIKKAKDLLGIDLGPIFDVLIPGDAEGTLEKWKKDFNENLDLSDDYTDAAEKNEKAKETWQASATPDVVEEGINNGGIITSGGQTTNWDIETHTPTNEEAESDGASKGSSWMTGWLSSLTSSSEEGGTNVMESFTKGLSNFDSSDSFIKSIDTNLFNDKGMIDLGSDKAQTLMESFGGAANFSEIMGNMGEDGWSAFSGELSPEKIQQLMSTFNTSAEASVDLSKTKEKVGKQTKEVADEANKNLKEVGKDTDKNPKEITKTQKQTVKIEQKVEDKSVNTSMKTSAEGAGKSWTSTFRQQQASIKTNIMNTLRNAAAGARSQTVYASFKSSGIYTANGLLNGLESKMESLYNKGVKMAQKVNSGYKNTVEQHSPSRVFFKNALFTAQGLLNGFDSKMGAIYKAGAGMGEAATDGTRTALAQMSSLLAGDMDTTPTIRPVLDLTDVANGARSINGMLGGRTLSVNSLTANSLAASMNSRQNRSDMVLSALDNLSRTMSSQSTGNTYNINGITYDDGSNIATAIGMLAHAAIVEGRA